MLMRGRLAGGIAALAVVVVAWLGAAPAEAASNVLTWVDNSANELNFEVWAKVVPTPAPPAVLNCAADSSPYALLATLGPSAAATATYTHAGLAEGTTHCYEVRATNAAGASAFSNQAGRTVPFTAPAAPSALGVAGGP